MSFSPGVVYSCMNNSRWLSLIVLCTGVLLIVVDMTIVNVALPSIQRDLAFSQAGLAGKHADARRGCARERAYLAWLDEADVEA